MDKFFVFGHENHSKQVHKVRLSELYQLDQLFLTFWKKKDFSRFWLNIFYQKNKIVPKWEKVSFDGLFELAIVDLVGIDF